MSPRSWESMAFNSIPLTLTFGDSHANTDHVGRPSLFPESTNLVVGPGIKESFFTGYPAVEESPVLAREFAGRAVKELAPPQFNMEIRGLRAAEVSVPSSTSTAAFTSPHQNMPSAT
ncbi:hypothetical protein BDW69DRAFT_189481 [Aspergillus filifer]